MFTNEIIKKALSLAGFSDVQSLTEIINAVPNPEIALAMMLGVYEKKTSYAHKYYKSTWYDYIYEIKDTNELLNTCLLEQHKPNVKEVWYLSKEDYALGNYVDSKPASSYTNKSVVAATGFKTELVTEKLEILNSSVKPISEAEFYSLLTSFSPSVDATSVDFAMAG